MGIFQSFSQCLRELLVQGYRLLSAYTMWLSVLLLTHNGLLPEKSCAVSVSGIFFVPHISDVYNSIGLI